MKSLVEILEHYPTDKLANGYGEFYEELFRPIRHSTESVLEIGIAQGGSVRAWRDYFPHATIHCLDKEKQFVDGVAFMDRVEAYQLDVSNECELDRWAEGRWFDLIIDDGSHMDEDILTAYQILFRTSLYIIEDLTIVRNSETLEYFHGIANDGIDMARNGYVMFRPQMIVVQRK